MTGEMQSGELYQGIGGRGGQEGEIRSRQGGAVRGVYQEIGGRGGQLGVGGVARRSSEGDIPGDRWERGQLGGGKEGQ